MQKLFPTRFIHGDADQKSTPPPNRPRFGGGTRPNVRLSGICPKTTKNWAMALDVRTVILSSHENMLWVVSSTNQRLSSYFGCRA